MNYACGTIVARSPVIIRHYCRGADCKSCSHDALERRLGRFLNRSCLPLDPNLIVTSFEVSRIIDHAQFRYLRRQIHQRVCYLRSNSNERWATFGLIGVWTGTNVIGIAVGGRKSVLLDMGWRLDHMPLCDVATRMARPSAQTLPLKGVWVTVSPQRTMERPSGSNHPKPSRDIPIYKVRHRTDILGATVGITLC